MEKIQEVWAAIRQLITSRTIWGGVILLLNAVGINLGDASALGDAVTHVGDSAMNLIGAALVLIGYLDRRPKPGMVEVKAPS